MNFVRAVRYVPNPPPGISGSVHITPVLEDPPSTGVGRFGWKCQLSTVLSFTADAMVQEMGITSRIFPEDNPPNNDFVLLAACDPVADPEDVPDANGNEFVDMATDFQRFLAAPPQTPRSGMAGEALFAAVGCADCHMSGFTADGDDETEDAISGETVNAYSDFLLHDMGGNGDFIVQGGADLTELRTTPLWGLRLRDPLWHDGRVAGGTFDFRIFNAVLLHDTSGSEAQASGAAYLALPTGDQLKIIQFLDSLGRREFDLDGNGFISDGDLMLIDDCVATGGPFGPDDLCALADADQDGFVDADDLDLLNVVLGIPDDDEDDDSDSDDGSSDDGSGINRGDFIAVGERNAAGNGGAQSLAEGPPAPTAATADGNADDLEQERQRRSLKRRTASRRGL